MKKGFYWIMSAQFMSSFADNALLIVAIKMLTDMDASPWMTPMLRNMFVISYVLLAAFVATFADSRPKGQVMFVTNIIKIAGLSLMMFTVHPLLAYAVVGLGAAAYSPAKYGILTELLPAERLVFANAWIEGTTVASIILGFAIGGALYNPEGIGGFLVSLHLPGAHTAAEAALWVILLFYMGAALCNLQIPDTGARYAKPRWEFVAIAKNFGHSVYVLWHDKLGQISLAMTTIIWAAAATLQLIVLNWAQDVLGLPDHKAPTLLGVVAIGVAVGAIAAAKYVPLKRALSVAPLGMIMGAACIVLAFFSKSAFPDVHILGLPLYMIAAMLFLIAVGALAGFFVVPMNALLQHRGYVRLSAGHSIAVQNFTENIGIVVMLGFYAVLLETGLKINTIIIIFGFLLMTLIGLVMLWNRVNMKERDWSELIGEEKAPDMHQ